MTSPARPAAPYRSSRATLVALILLGAACAVVTAVPAAATERLGDAVRPLGQRIALELDPRRDDYRGTTTLELEVVRATPEIRLHARAMQLERVELRPEGGISRTLRPTPGADAVVALVDDLPIAPGRYRLTIEFAAPYNRNAVALYKTEIQGAPYLFTQFEATDARGAFPCFDEPSFKIPFELELTVPAGFDLVANTGIESESAAAGGGRVVRFRQTRPLPSYLVAFAVGSFDFVEIPGLSIPGRVVTPKGMSKLAGAAVEMTPPILAALERWFGSPYPYDKLDLLAIPEYWFGAMENPGAITFAAALLLPGTTPSADDRRTLAQTTAHELAHIWFGDYVTLAWWDDFWLNESFADWMGDKIAEQVDPELGIAAGELGTIDARMTADARPSVKPVRIAGASPEEMMQSADAAYSKGKAVLAMVEGWLGAERFRAGLLDYLARHAWGNATGADLWSALARASELPVEPVLRSFIEQPGLPLVVVEPLGGARVRLAQRRYATAGVTLPATSWKIPLRLRAGDGTRAIERRIVLDAEPLELSFDGLATIDWLLPNAGPSGYYRWQLPPAAFDRLAAAAPAALTPFERRHLLGNAAALLASGDLGAEGYLNLLVRLAGDADPGVIDGVLDALGTIRAPLARDGTAPGWRRLVGAALQPPLERIGRTPRPGEPPQVAALRPRLLEWLGEEGGEREALDWGRREVDAILAGRSTLDDDLAASALELAAVEGDRALYERYLSRALAPATDPAERNRFLYALTAFRDRKLAEETLALYPAGKVRADELFFVFALAAQGPALRDRLLDWTIEQYPKLATDLPPEFHVYLVSAGRGCDRARFERAAAFFGTPERAIPGMAPEIAEVGDAVTACVELRGREGAAAERFLAGFAPH